MKNTILLSIILFCIISVYADDVQHVELYRKNDFPGQSITFDALKTPLLSVRCTDISYQGFLLGMVSDSLIISTKEDSIYTRDIKIHVMDVRDITEIKRSIFGASFLLGILAGGTTGYLLGSSGGDRGFISASQWGSLYAGYGSAIGGTLGALIGLGSGVNKHYELSDLSYFEKVQIIRKLGGYKQ